MRKHYDTQPIGTNAVRIKYWVENELKRSVTIRVGEYYWVQPDNPQKLKHRGKKCLIKNFNSDQLGFLVQANVYFVDEHKRGKVELIDLVIEIQIPELQSSLPLENKNDQLPRYLPSEVPDDLFTNQELSRMGKVPTNSVEAFVKYLDQKREFKLFRITETRDSKRQSGYTLVRKDYGVQEVLDRRHGTQNKYLRLQK